ncbi:MAG: murein biosynthesis integral membrane protein MurJ [Pseudomonadota bacterium]|nr:murein biosynthesis integral membrane protein MurJ [Pseudomonadota bacterium]
MSTSPPKPEPRLPEDSYRRPSPFRSTVVVSSMTLLSRASGLIRDVVFARFFGAGIVMDAFFVAFKLPNMFRRFFAEGAFSQSFVPVFAEYDEQKTHEETKELIDKVSGTLGFILFAFTLIGVIAAPILIGIAGMGWLLNPDADSSAKFDLAVDMLRFTFPYLLFISLTALAGAILNTYQRFSAAAFVPVLLNLVLIVFAAFLAPEFANPGVILAIGVFVAGLVQLIFLLPFLARVKALPRPRWGWQHSGVKKIVKLMLPAIFGSSVAQINILFDTLLASFLATGSISWLYYSDRLMEFPLGVFGIALATVILPSLSREHAAESLERFSSMFDWALRIALIVAVPASVGLFVLSGPALVTIFYGGKFSTLDVEMAQLSLMAYSFGLLGFIMVKVLVPGYFARQDTKTPVRIGIIALIANMILNLLIVIPWYQSETIGPHAGLAVATSISAILNATLLYRGLRRDGVIKHSSGWSKLLAQVIFSTFLMAIVLIMFLPDIEVWLSESLLQNCFRLLVAVLGGTGCYFFGLFLCGMRPSTLRWKS